MNYDHTATGEVSGVTMTRTEIKKLVGLYLKKKEVTLTEDWQLWVPIGAAEDVGSNLTIYYTEEPKTSAPS